LRRGESGPGLPTGRARPTGHIKPSPYLSGVETTSPQEGLRFFQYTQVVAGRSLRHPEPPNGRRASCHLRRADILSAFGGRASRPPFGGRASCPPDLGGRASCPPSGGGHLARLLPEADILSAFRTGGRHSARLRCTAIPRAWGRTGNLPIPAAARALGPPCPQRTGIPSVVSPAGGMGVIEDGEKQSVSDGKDHRLRLSISPSLTLSIWDDSRSSVVKLSCAQRGGAACLSYR